MSNLKSAPKKDIHLDLLLLDIGPSHRAVFSRQVADLTRLGLRAHAGRRVPAHVRVEVAARLGAVAALGDRAQVDVVLWRDVSTRISSHATILRDRALYGPLSAARPVTSMV